MNNPLWKIIEEAHDFLDKLVGRWELTGQIYGVPLHQPVEVEWMPPDLFCVIMRFVRTRQTLLIRREEAVYFIGYNAEHDHYKLDIDNDPDSSRMIIRLPVIGQRQGNAISFVYDYPIGYFTHSFIYDEASDSWNFEQTQVRDGQRHTFATKRMVREKVEKT